MNYYNVRFNERLTSEADIERTDQEDALDFLAWLITHLDKVRKEAIEKNIPHAKELPDILSYFEYEVEENYDFIPEEESVKNWSNKKVKMLRVTLHPDKDESMSETLARYS